ncbi:hypothetical protein M900_2769 [Bacteriovorax sp. Seq25_V]|nr:hypothetical protein M900_2769 [Bacteriovorax sp. Seq25_V]
MDETYKLTPRHSSFYKEQELQINSIEFKKKSNGCYILEYGGKCLEIPQNWGVFDQKNKEQIYHLKDLDETFVNIIQSYFKISAELYLGFNDNGPYFFMGPEIKKAA